MRESDTRLVPYEHAEIAYARNRPHHERPPIPRPGDRIYYRREFWDENPVLATVVDVQDLDDHTDPDLWEPVKNVYGQQIYDAGVPRFAPMADPWPWVWLRPDDTGRIAQTKESRVRGAPGWLPLNWRDRPVRLPGDLVMRPLPPRNVPTDQLRR